MKLAFAFLGCSMENCIGEEGSRFCQFDISTYTPSEGQYLWNEALCCPLCGETWARKAYDHAQTKWIFEARECGQQLLSASDLDYFLLLDDLSVQQMEFLIHEYVRCAEYYRSDSSGRPASFRIPDISEL